MLCTIVPAGVHAIKSSSILLSIDTLCTWPSFCLYSFSHSRFFLSFLLFFPLSLVKNSSLSLLKTEKNLQLVTFNQIGGFSQCITSNQCTLVEPLALEILMSDKGDFLMMGLQYTVHKL